MRCQKYAFSGWLALFLMFIFPLAIVPFALTTGIVALWDMRPGARGRWRAWFAIIMGAMFLLLLFVEVFGIRP